MTLLRWRFRLLLVALVGATIAFWRPSFEVFATPKATLVWLCAIAVAAVTVVAWLREGEIRISRSPLLWAVAGLIAAMAIATVTSEYPGLSLRGQYRRWTGLLPYGAYMLLGLAAVAHASAREIDRVFEALLAAGAVVIGYALLQAVGADPFEWVNGEGNFSTLGNINFAAATVGMVLPVAVREAVRGRTAMRRGLGIAMTVAAAAALAVMGSTQGPVVGLVTTAFLAVTLWLDRRPATRARLAERPGAAWAAVVAVVVLGVGALASVAPRLESILGIGYRARLFFYEAGVRIFADHPLLGTGLDTYGAFFTRYQPPAHAQTFGYASPDEPHSVLLGMFSDGGLLLGLTYVAVIVVVGSVIVRGLRDPGPVGRDRIAGLGAVWLGYVLQSVVSIDEPSLALTHWLVAGLVVGAALRPSAWTWRLPWGPEITKKGKRRPRRGRLPLVASVAVVAVIVVAVVAGWTVTRPLRADVAAFEGVRLTTIAAQDDRAYEVAEGAFGRAQRLAPWEASHYFHESALHATRAIDAEALEAQVRAAELAPWQPIYALNVAELAARTGQVEEAARWADHAVEHDPYQVLTLVRAARLYEQVGREDAAEATARRAIGLLPNLPEAQEILDRIG